MKSGQFPNLLTESVGSRRELVANCVHTTDNATKQFHRIGGVDWALNYLTVLSFQPFDTLGRVTRIIHIYKRYFFNKKTFT